MVSVLLLPAQTHPRRITPYCYNTNNGKTIRTTLRGSPPLLEPSQNRHPAGISARCLQHSVCVCSFSSPSLEHPTGSCCLAVAASQPASQALQQHQITRDSLCHCVHEWAAHPASPNLTIPLGCCSCTDCCWQSRSTSSTSSTSLLPTWYTSCRCSSSCAAPQNLHCHSSSMCGQPAARGVVAGRRQPMSKAMTGCSASGHT